jgi:hypothetical protein
MIHKKFYPWRLLLVLLLVGISLHSIYFIAHHNRPLQNDPVSNLIPSVYLRQAVEGGSLQAFERWLESTGHRPPLPAILNLPAMLLIEDQVNAIRYTELVAYLLCLLLLFRLGERLSGGAAGLMAAVLFGLFPHTVGWSHMANADPYIWLSLLLLFSILLRLDMRSTRHAVALGCAVGLCAGVRLLCFPYLTGAAFYIALTTRWKLKTAGNLLISGGCVMAICGWWFLLKTERWEDTIIMASGNSTVSMGRDISIYLDNGLDVFIIGAMLAGIVALRGRLMPWRRLLLFALWILVPLAQFLFVWDSWSRYLLPLFPACVLLIAVVLERGMVRWPARLRVATRGGVFILAALPLLYFIIMYDVPMQTGFISPQDLPFDGFSRTIAVLPQGTPVLVVNEKYDPLFVNGINLTRRRPRFRLYTSNHRDRLFGLKPGVKVSHVLHTHDPRVKQISEGHSSRYRKRAWQTIKQRLPLKRVARVQDSDGLVYTLYRSSRSFEQSDIVEANVTD